MLKMKVFLLENSAPGWLFSGKKVRFGGLSLLLRRQIPCYREGKKLACLLRQNRSLLSCKRPSFSVKFPKIFHIRRLQNANFLDLSVDLPADLSVDLFEIVKKSTCPPKKLPYEKSRLFWELKMTTLFRNSNVSLF